MGVSFFRDVNYVWVKYCGGDFHTGTRNASVGGLYYSGHLSLKATIAKLKQTTTINSASLVLFTGGSAGGIGVIANFDYVKSQFPSAAFKAWPSSGWFPEDIVPLNANLISLVASYQTLYSQGNAYLNQACVAAHPSNPWLCYSGQNVYPYIGSTPLFVSQALFDMFAQGFYGVTNISSPGDIKFMSHYGQAMRNSFRSAEQQGGNSVGLFLTSDNVHEFGFGTVVNGHSLQEIAGNWIDGLSLVKEISNCTYITCTPVPYKGCYNDQSTRDLPFEGPQTNTQTIEACQSFCKSNSFLYAGLQFSRECRCGNSYGIYGPDLSGCNQQCTGNAQEYCGAAYHNDIYHV